MARIPEHILDEIQDRCDIVEVISSYIPLKPAGRNFKALCPFHHEKTPSFVVSPDKQIYHCFGCNSGGNVFNFIKEYEKIDFIDTIRMLAEKTGVELPRYEKDGKDGGSFVSRLYSINDIAANYYCNLLEKASMSTQIRRYIDKRGLEETWIKKFRLGYADSSWKSLLDYLSKRGVTSDFISKAGLVFKGKDGSFYDLFRNRLIFPISEVRGKVIGFGARVLDDTLPKYINSPESAIYTKGEHLYGLNFAKSDIREKGFAIITEGYFDVITSHQYGIKNTISSLGTALTVAQIRLLRRYTHNAVMVYDADQAGEMATMRGLDIFLEEGMNVKIAALEKGHDPDSFIRKFGPRGFDAAIKKAKTLFAYKLGILKERFDSKEPESKADIVKEMLESIRRVRNAVIKADYIKKLSEELSIKEDAIWDELRKINKGYKRRGVKDIGERIMDQGKDVKKSADIPPAERILVRLMLEDMNVVNIVRTNLKPFDFKNPHIRDIVERLFSMDVESRFIDGKKLISHMEGKVNSGLISFIISEDMDIMDKGRNVSDCIRAIRKERRQERLNEIQNKLVRAQKNGCEDEANALLVEFNKLIRT